MMSSNQHLRKLLELSINNSNNGSKCLSGTYHEFYNRLVTVLTSLHKLTYLFILINLRQKGYVYYFTDEEMGARS